MKSEKLCGKGESFFTFLSRLLLLHLFTTPHNTPPNPRQQFVLTRIVQLFCRRGVVEP